MKFFVTKLHSKTLATSYAMPWLKFIQITNRDPIYDISPTNEGELSLRLSLDAYCQLW